MSTTVKVSACCADDIEVMVAVGGDEAILQNGEEKEFTIYGDIDLYVCEQSKDVEPLDDLGDTTADSSSGTPAEFDANSTPVDVAPNTEGGGDIRAPADASTDAPKPVLDTLS